MDARKILSDLQYRINTAPEGDPERGNAIRVRDRLLARLGMSLDDIVVVHTRRTLEKLTLGERQMICQFLRKQFDREELMNGPHAIGIYYQKGKASPYSRSIELDMTDEEYNHLWPIVLNLLKIYRRELSALQKKIKQETQARLEAYDFKFYEKAGILFPANPDAECHDPGFGLKEAMEAAAALNDIVFPTNHLNCDPKQLPHQI